jgi:hypothetical protein
VGGRIFSIRGLPPAPDLALDAGGYRFIETDLLPAQLVWDAIRLPTSCYVWQCAGGCEGSGNCYVIKDTYGNNFGYVHMPLLASDVLCCPLLVCVGLFWPLLASAGL